MNTAYRRRRRRGVGAATLVHYDPGMSIAALGFTFTGPANRTYIDINGVRQTVGLNSCRDGHYIGGVRTLLLEGAKTLYFINGTAPATQTTPSLPIGTYILWIEGTGSIAVAQTTAVITGAGSATAAAPLVFNVTTAGTVTCTVTGSVTRAQLENGNFKSSFFNVAAAPTTRTAETISLAFARLVQPITLYEKHIDLGSQASNAGLFEVGQFGLNPAMVAYHPAAATIAGAYHDGTAQRNTSTFNSNVVNGDTFETRAVLNPDGTMQLGISRNGAAETVSTFSPAGLFPAVNFANSAIKLNQYTGSATGFMALVRLSILTGPHSLGRMRAA